MAKKRAKRNSRRVRRSVRSSRTSSRGASSKNKMWFVVSNLLISIILAVASSVLGYYIKNDLLKSLLWVLALVFGVIGVAFFIILIILVLLKVSNK
jgi:hypothetical protein